MTIEQLHKEYKSSILLFIFHFILHQLYLLFIFHFILHQLYRITCLISFLIKLLRFKMKTNQTQSDMWYIVVGGVYRGYSFIAQICLLICA